MKKFVIEKLFEDDMGAAIPIGDPDIAQKLANGQIALNKEDLKLNALKDKIRQINKKKSQIQKAMVKAQEENARKMAATAREQAKGKTAAEKAAAAEQAKNIVAQGGIDQTPVQPAVESFLQSNIDSVELFEDYVVVEFKKETPDYDKLIKMASIMLEAADVYKECDGCGKTYNMNDTEFYDGVCPKCAEEGKYIKNGKFHENKNPLSKELFYNLSEAYVEDIDDTEKAEDIDYDYLFYVKIIEDDDWFIGKIYKISPDEDWYGELTAGNSETFDEMSYDASWDEAQVIGFLQDNYDSVEIIEEEEYNDYIDDMDDIYDDIEESGITGMKL